jgi:hypothetical protein
MPYRIARRTLLDFVDRQLVLIDSTPLPDDLRRALAGEDLGDDELAAIWLAAGVATQIGLAIVEEPERFVVSTRSGATLAEAAPP